MKYKVPAVLAFTVFFFGALPSRAQHGGFGGHMSGGFSGHSMGHSGGHSFGHSFGRMFGHHSGGHGKGTSSGKGNLEEPPLAGAAMVHGRVVQLPRPEGVMLPPRQRLPHRPVTEFGFGPRTGFFGLPGNSRFAFCGSFGGFPQRHFFGGDFDCFRGDFFFDPFFLAGFFPVTFSTWDLGGPPGFSDMMEPSEEQQPPPEPGTFGDENHPQARSQTQRGPDTLLQLTDGSMYGLTDYWVAGDRLHYVTNYGGENSVPLARIDFTKTIELNDAQGVKFDLSPKAPERKP
jgi:hypothetical protein